MAFTGHGDSVTDPAARARAIVDHHERRLEQTAETLESGPQTAYETSLALWPDLAEPVLRRFALAETCAHAEYLVLAGAAERHEVDGIVRYEGAA